MLTVNKRTEWTDRRENESVWSGTKTGSRWLHVFQCMHVSIQNQRVEMISNYQSLNDSMANNMHDAHVFTNMDDVVSCAMCILSVLHFTAHLKHLSLPAPPLSLSHSSPVLLLCLLQQQYTLTYTHTYWSKSCALHPTYNFIFSRLNCHYHRKSVFIYRRLNKNLFCRLFSSSLENVHKFHVANKVHARSCCMV